MTKRRKQKKPLTRAEQEALESYRKMIAAWDKLPKFGRGPRPTSATAKMVAQYVPSSRPCEGGPVKTNFDSLKGPTYVKTSTQYTGSNMKGTAGLHKSNEVPVFSNEEILDIARMRRN